MRISLHRQLLVRYPSRPSSRIIPELRYNHNMKSILITGGAGFIGINAAERFISTGWKVTIVDNLSRLGADLNLAWLKSKYTEVDFLKIDIRDYDQITDAISKAKPDVLLHLASQVAVTKSFLNPLNDFGVNALGTLNILEALRLTSQNTHLIYASTNKVYGDLKGFDLIENIKRYVPKEIQTGINEKQTLDFHSPYGCSKGAADQYVLDYGRNFDLQTTVLRQSCIYGPRQFGVEDQGWVAWFIIATLLEQDITVFGNGKQVRDLLHVSDLIDLYETLISRPRIENRVFNVGGGEINTLSLIELIDLLGVNFGHNPRIRFASERLGDQKYFVSDNKLLSDIGWEPQIGLSKGITDLFAWISENLKMIRIMHK